MCFLGGIKRFLFHVLYMKPISGQPVVESCGVYLVSYNIALLHSFAGSVGNNTLLHVWNMLIGGWTLQIVL